MTLGDGEAAIVPETCTMQNSRHRRRSGGAEGGRLLIPLRTRPAEGTQTVPYAAAERFLLLPSATHHRHGKSRTYRVSLIGGGGTCTRRFAFPLIHVFSDKCVLTDFSLHRTNSLAVHSFAAPTFPPPEKTRSSS